MPENSTDNIPLAVEIIDVCAFNDCSEQNTQKCRKCQRQFCIMHANRFSPNFCMECFKNLALIESKFTRTFEDFDENTEKLIITKQSCAKYYMDGPDWLFLTAWIDKLNDEELRANWNFHFFIMKTIEAENETRKIKKAEEARLRPKIGLVTTTVRTATGTTRVTKQADTAEDVRRKLKAQGLPAAIIDQMISAMGMKP